MMDGENVKFLKDNYIGEVKEVFVFDKTLSKKEKEYFHLSEKRIVPSEKDMVEIKNIFKFCQLLCKHIFEPHTAIWKQNGISKIQIYKVCKKCDKIKRVE